MKVALLANLKHNAPVWPGISLARWEHLYTWATIDAILTIIEKAGHQAIYLEGDDSLYNNLQALRPDLCFNLCQGHFGNVRKAQVPAILEMLRIPYTGARPGTLALDRPVTKRLLLQQGLSILPFQVFERIDENLKPDLQFPLVVRRSREGAGLDLDQPIIVENDIQLRRQLAEFLNKNKAPALVEQFIPGSEIIVGVVGNLPRPAARQVPQERESPALFEGLTLFPPLAAVTSHEGQLHSYSAVLSETEEKEVAWLAAATYRVLECFDAAQLKFQLDARQGDKIYITDVDPLPSLKLDAQFCQVAAHAGWSYEKLVATILDGAIKRTNQKVSSSDDALANLEMIPV